MKINITSAIKLTSESATKKAQTNAKAFFGSKGLSILNKLEEYNKEKAVNTQHIADFLLWLSKVDADVAGAYPKTAAGKKVQTAFRAVVAAKTFPAIMKAIKAAKVTAAMKKSVDAPASSVGTPSMKKRSALPTRDLKRLYKTVFSAQTEALGIGDPASQSAIFDLFSKFYSPNSVQRITKALFQSDFALYGPGGDITPQQYSKGLKHIRSKLSALAIKAQSLGLPKKVLLEDVMGFGSN